MRTQFIVFTHRTRLKLDEDGINMKRNVFWVGGGVLNTVECPILISSCLLWRDVARLKTELLSGLFPRLDGHSQAPFHRFSVYPPHTPVEHLRRRSTCAITPVLVPTKCFK